MFNIGGGELLVIGLVALIVLGPQRLPDAARQAGKVLADLRRLSTGFQDELKGAFSDSEISAGPTTRTAPERLPSADDGATSSAIAAVSDQRPRRRAPLQAAQDGPTAPHKPASKRPAKTAAVKATKKAPSRSGPPRNRRPPSGGG